MSLIKRISIVDKAVLTATGNSSVICGSSTATNFNTSDMITLNGTTTRDYTQSGSMAILNMLTNSTVLYAELIWYSTVASTATGAVDVRSIQDNPITFIMPNGDIKPITPDNGQDFITPTSGSTVRFRSANVTNIINSYGAGSYSVSNVPTSIPPIGLSDVRYGWSLNVVYRNNAFPPKKVDFMSGIVYATPTQPYQTTISGFTTPSTAGSINGTMLLTAGNGETLTGNETVSAGPSLANLTVLGNPVGTPNPNPLTAPNNPYNNFFAGQINICNPLSSSMGLIDITGTNGTVNHNAFVPTQVIGARNKWDMTDLDISGILSPDQTQLAFQLTASGYSVQLLSIGTEVDAIAPDITVNFDVYNQAGNTSGIVEVGETLLYVIDVNNAGKLAADNVTLSLNPGSYASIVPGTLRLNSNILSGDITTGVNIGSVPAYGVSRITFEVTITALPPVNQSGTNAITSAANYSYQFVSGVTTITNSGISNSKTLTVEEGDLTIVKSVSSLTPKIGDTVIYTNVITNVGTQTSSNIVFQDLDTPYTTFVPNSVYINNVQQSGLDPNAGFSLANLAAAGSTTIKYSVIIDSAPPSGIINTNSVIKYSYLIGNSSTIPTFMTELSNAVSLAVQYSQIMKTTCPSTNYPNVGDTVTYTTSLINAGNIAASNVFVKDAPVTGAAFIDGTVTVNGTAVPGVNPYVGFALSSPIAAGATTTVKYNVKINSLPPKETIDNTAQVPFQYTVTTEQGTISDTKISNTVETLSNFVCMAMTEVASKTCVTIGDTIYYTVNVTNSGNISASNTLFTSIIQAETSFIPGSVTINGVAYPNYNPNTGFSIGTICAGNTIQVIYAVTVNSIPSGNIVYNQANLSYSYYPDPAGNAVNESITGNKVQTNINVESYTATMAVDKRYAVNGDSIEYTATLNNTGTVDLYNIKFYDDIPVFAQFIAGTVYVNGTNYPNYDPTLGFNIDNLNPGDSAKVVFAAKITSVPSARAIINQGEFTFAYQTCSDSPVVTMTVYTNAIRTIVVNGSLFINKATNKTYAVLGDTITYSFNAVNNGNVQLNNVLFSDNLDPSLQFVTGSVMVKNVSVPSYNPATGFTLGDINIGQSVTISFDAKVINVPNPNVVSNYGTGTFTFTIDPNQQPVTQSVNSNTVTTVINSSDSIVTKQVDKAYSTIGDILTYTIAVNNTGTVPLTSITLLDLLQSDLQFVNGSVSINGIAQPGYNPNNGFAIGDIAALSTATIVFQAKVITAPSNNNILNSATINYQYTLIPGGQTYNATRTSNTVTTVINTISVTNTKNVDKAYATSNDILTYTSIIKNTSTVSISNTNFTDVIPFDTTFVTGSVTIDGTPYSDYNPQTGFTLGTISANQSVTVVFKVKVISSPTVEVVNNQSNLSYSYQLNPNSPAVYGNTTSNIASTIIKIGVDSITKIADRVYARLNDYVTYTINIANGGNTILQNASFKDSIQSDSTFVTDSVYINGVQQKGYNPNTGFPLPNIQIGSAVQIVFQVQVNAIPAVDGKLNNNGTVTYSYYVDPNGSPYTQSHTSNTTTVNVLDTIISATKAVDKSIAKINDTINYTVVISNKGNVPAQTVNFIDKLDSNLQFVTGSVVIESTPQPSYDPNIGFPLPDIAGGGSVTVKFTAKIISRPSDNTVYNSAATTYTYTIGGVVYNGTMQTNIVTTTVAYGELTITKSLDKTYGNIGDTISYSVIIKNTGSVNATSMTFKDIIQSDALFNTGSVFIDDISYPSYNPNTGFALADLVPGSYHIVSFSVKIVTLPASGQINNAAATQFTYKLSSTDTPVTTTATSNTVVTYVNLGSLTITKSVDKAYATINDVVTYTLDITNTGNVVCSNVFFKDAVQSDAAFVAGSVIINDSVQAGYDPNIGFSLPNINPNVTVKVIFKVNVNAVPTNKILYNTGTASYQYIANPNSAPVTSTAISNTVQTVINTGQLNVVKSVDKAYATVGDTVTYTVNITNSGTVNALAVNFRDVIKAGLAFVTGSVTIGGVSYPSYDPYDSFSLGTLTPGQTVQVVFKAKVTSIPTPNVVSNIANIIFSYYIDPSGTITTVQTDSNAITTTINVASISLTKAVDKPYATAKDVLTYNFVLTNTGNIDLNDVIFTDNLQSDVTFNVGSVIVNNVPQPNYDPTKGFNLGTVSTLAVINISFKVTVIASPVNSSVIDFAYATFSYKINPSGETYTNTTNSNTVSTIIIDPNISANKAVDLSFATIGDTINYTILVENTGNYLLTSAYLVDTLSNGGTFIAASVIIDGTSYPSYNPITGFSLPNLLPGNSTKVQFQATVAALPTPPVITNYAIATAQAVITQTGTTINVSATTNTVSTTVAVGSLSSAKTVDKLYARVGDTLTYTSTITNTGNVTATSAFFKDILQSELTFVAGSVMIGTVSYPNLNPNTGFSLSDIAAGSSVTITFNASINAMPVPPLVNNSSTTTFKYKINPTGPDYSSTSTSNTVTTNVVRGQLAAVKTVDKSIATVGDDLTYTITLTNTGNVAANDIVFTDTPSAGAVFKAGTVIVNNVPQSSYDPTKGFPVPSIAVGGVATIAFKATVTSVPASNTVTNTAIATFSYVVDPKQQPYTGTATSNTTTTNIELGKLDVTKAVDKNYATIGDKLTYTITIKNVGNIDATNVQFLDPTPANTMYVAGTVTVNGTSYPAYNPAVGFNIGTIIPGQTITVVYQVQVLDACTN